MGVNPQFHNDLILVGWLFKIGEFFSGLPDIVKRVILVLLAAFSVIEAVKLYNAISDIITGLRTIGSLKTVMTVPAPVTAAPVPVAAAAGAGAAGETGGVLGLRTPVCRRIL